MSSTESSSVQIEESVQMEVQNLNNNNNLIISDEFYQNSQNQQQNEEHQILNSESEIGQMRENPSEEEIVSFDSLTDEIEKNEIINFNNNNNNNNLELNENNNTVENSSLLITEDISVPLENQINEGGMISEQNSENIKNIKNNDDQISAVELSADNSASLKGQVFLTPTELDVVNSYLQSDKLSSCQFRFSVLPSQPSSSRSPPASAYTHGLFGRQLVKQKDRGQHAKTGRVLSSKTPITPEVPKTITLPDWALMMRRLLKSYMQHPQAKLLTEGIHFRDSIIITPSDDTTGRGRNIDNNNIQISDVRSSLGAIKNARDVQISFIRDDSGIDPSVVSNRSMHHATRHSTASVHKRIIESDISPHLTVLSLNSILKKLERGEYKEASDVFTDVYNLFLAAYRHFSGGSAVWMFVHKLALNFLDMSSHYPLKDVSSIVPSTSSAQTSTAGIGSQVGTDLLTGGPSRRPGELMGSDRPSVGRPRDVKRRQSSLAVNNTMFKKPSRWMRTEGISSADISERDRKEFQELLAKLPLDFHSLLFVNFKNTARWREVSGGQVELDDNNTNPVVFRQMMLWCQDGINSVNSSNKKRKIKPSSSRFRFSESQKDDEYNPSSKSKSPKQKQQRRTIPTTGLSQMVDSQLGHQLSSSSLINGQKQPPGLLMEKPPVIIPAAAKMDALSSGDEQNSSADDSDGHDSLDGYF